MAEGNSVVELLQLGLRASELRGKAVANNIANLNTPGYRRKAVRFEQLLQKALASPGEADLDKVTAELYEPRTTAVDDQGNDVNMDREIGELLKNSARYKTYIRLLNKMYSQMQMAITGNIGR